MPLDLSEYLSTLNNYTNKLAEDIKNIKEKMRGRGILPTESALVIAKLQDIEDSLRKIGSRQ